MHPIPRSCWLAVAAVLLLAADDPSWKNKPISQWDNKDAQQVLADSPWVKTTKLDQVRDLSVDERRQGGNMDADSGHGVGLAGIDIFSPSARAAAIARAHAHPDLGTVVVRWESALPVRAAELKAGETDIPNWKGDYYAIAVYGIALPSRWNLASELKGIAFLQRDKKKDLKPVRVDILRHVDGLATIVYLFSRSNEITRKDTNIRFVAQIERMFVSQFFFPREMEFAGNPEF
jgi:hypothetical protein